MTEDVHQARGQGGGGFRLAVVQGGGRVDRVGVGGVRVCGREEGLDRWRSSEMSTRANTPGLFLPLIARFFAGARPTIDLHFKGSPA